MQVQVANLESARNSHGGGGRETGKGRGPNSAGQAGTLEVTLGNNRKHTP